MPRYVILRHEPGANGPRALHWDLMLEETSTLGTWALESEPARGQSIAATQLADHRLAYLDYEGPVSGDRGEVTRFDAGTFESSARASGVWRLELAGGILAGPVVLTHHDAQRWTVSFNAD